MTSTTLGDRWSVRSALHNREDVASTQGGDAMDKWVQLFGEPPRASAPKRYGKVSRLNSQLPDAYVGENLFLERHLEGLINAMGNVFTQELYPMVASDHVGKIEFTTWEFMRGVLHETPWEGVPQMFTTRKSARYATISRRMGALKFEGGHLLTDDGREEYDLKFQGMASVTLETMSMETLAELFRAVRKYREHQMSLNSNRLSLKQRIQAEKEGFAILNRSPSGFNKVITGAMQTMIKRKVAGPFYLLVPPGTINDLALEKYPDATQRLDSEYPIDGGNGLIERTAPMGRITLGNGITLVEVPDAMVETQTVPASPLSRRNVQGLSFMMAIPKHMFGVGLYSHQPYFSLSRAIRVWNTNGGYDVLTMREAIEHANFPDMETVLEVLDNGPPGRPGRQAWEKNDFDVNLDEHSNRAARKDNRLARRAHMMMCWDDYHSALPVRFFGQMDRNVLPFNVIRRMGETLARTCGVSPKQFAEAKDFFDTLKRAPGHHQFYARLSQTNTGRENTYEGAPDVLAYKNVPSITEFKPDIHGGLTLPDMSDITTNFIPPSMASNPGLQSIIKGGDIASKGYDSNLIEKAIEVDQTLEKLAEGLKSVMDALCVDPKTRSEWFHVPDPKTPLVEALFTGPLDPLFLRDGTAAEYTAVAAVSNNKEELGKGPGDMGATQAMQLPDSILKGVLNKNNQYLRDLIAAALNEQKNLLRDFELALLEPGLSREDVNRLVYGLGLTFRSVFGDADATREIITPIILRLVGGEKRRVNTRAARTEAKKLIDSAESMVTDDIPEGAASAIVGGAGYFRAPIVMTSGTLPYLRATIAAGQVRWVLPSDPKTGHLSAIGNLSDGLLEELGRRPSYRDPKTHMIGDSVYFSTHLESYLFGNRGEEEEMEGAAEGFQSSFSDTLAMGMQEASTGMDAALEAMDRATPLGAHLHSQEAQKAWATHGKTEEGRVHLPYGALLPGAEREDGAAGIYRTLLPILSDDRPETFGEVAAVLSISNVAMAVYATRQIGSGLLKAMTMAVIFSRCDIMEYWTDLEDNNVLSPCSAMVIRPAFECITGSGIFMKPGPETGVNVFGNLQTWVGGHTATQTVLVTMSLTTASVTKREKNIMPIENMVLQGVVSGGGDRWITSLEEIHDEDPHNRADLLPVILPVTENSLPESFSILGYFRAVLEDYVYEASKTQEYPHFSSYQYLATRLKPSNPENQYTFEDLYTTERDDNMDDLTYDGPMLPGIILRDEWIDSMGGLHTSQSLRNTIMQGEGAELVWMGSQFEFKASGYSKERTPLIQITS